MLDVALVTCRTLPEPDPDAEPLARALGEAGLSAAPVAWDAAGEPEAATLTVFRSCWNYPQHRAAFLRWVEAREAGSELWNPVPLVRWNTHKRYLVELAARGLPVAPTTLVPQGSEQSLAAIVDRHGWGDVVVKPAVSAASFRTRRVARDDRDAGEAHLRTIVADGDALVQDYMRSVEGYGERALIWIDGELTHAVRKSPRFEGDDESVSSGAEPIAPAEAELARRALAAIDGEPLYARIDVAPGPDGAPLLMELELVEPSLFFEQSPAALARFVDAIGRLVARAGR